MGKPPVRGVPGPECNAALIINQQGIHIISSSGTELGIKQAFLKPPVQQLPGILYRIIREGSPLNGTVLILKPDICESAHGPIQPLGIPNIVCQGDSYGSFTGNIRIHKSLCYVFNILNCDT